MHKRQADTDKADDHNSYSAEKGPPKVMVGALPLEPLSFSFITRPAKRCRRIVREYVHPIERFSRVDAPEFVSPSGFNLWLSHQAASYVACPKPCLDPMPRLQSSSNHRQGLAHPQILSEPNEELTTLMREIVGSLYAFMPQIDQRLRAFDKEIDAIFKGSEACQRIAKIRRALSARPDEPVSLS
jgi:hypothetical protein